jgi:hypothetical protein
MLNLRFSPLVIAPLALLFGMTITACSDSSSDGDAPGGNDAATQPDADSGATPETGMDTGTEPDTGTDPDTGTEDVVPTEAGEDAEPDAPEVDSGPFVCDDNGFTSVKDRTEILYEDSGDRVWIYNGTGDATTTFESLSIQVYESYNPPMVAGTYTIAAKDTSYETCARCILFSTECEKNLGTTSCNKVLMPRAGSTYTVDTYGSGPGATFHVTLDNIELQEVEIDIDTYETTPVANGSTWCLNDVETSSVIVEPGYVDLPQPTGCDYPAPPYFFLGPEPGQSTPEMGTVPPMAWPGAFFGGTEVGFDLAQYKCDHPEIKTLFIMVGAGWCSACKDFFETMVCNDGGLEEELHALNAEMLYVIIDNNTPGSPATNTFANTKMNSYGCEGGYRFSDTDNSAEFRVIGSSNMFAGIPWSAAIRMSDMKLTDEQPDTDWLDFVAIATANNQ